METLIKYILSGLASGGIYACIALSVVMIYKAIGHINFAQGEMATLSAYAAWQTLAWGLPIWAALGVSVALSFMGGYLLERFLFRRIAGAPVLTHIVMFIGLFLLINSGTGFIWTFTVKSFPSPFGEKGAFGGGLIGTHEIGMLAVTLVILLLLSIFFQKTRIGLAMRAIASNPQSSRLVGINVAHVTAVGWGLSAAVGAIAGLLIAPLVFLDPNMMLGIVVPAFAGAVMGGLTSPVGAVVGGFVVGVIESLAGAYIPVIGIELKLPIVLVIIICVLVVKPNGLFGKRILQRV
ncbi:branched-chain amino acid ABC transporter permease [Bradyrhizobium manausense]